MTILSQLFSGCPVVVCNGPAETGKSTSIRAALSFCGSQASSMYVKGSSAFFLERSSISTLPFTIDDPPKSGSGVDIVMDLYNTCKNANLRRGSLVPESVPIIATNFSLKMRKGSEAGQLTFFSRNLQWPQQMRKKRRIFRSYRVLSVQVSPANAEFVQYSSLQMKCQQCWDGKLGLENY
jgi:hypothetical protein